MEFILPVPSRSRKRIAGAGRRDLCKKASTSPSFPSRNISWERDKRVRDKRVRVEKILLLESQ